MTSASSNVNYNSLAARFAGSVNDALEVANTFEREDSMQNFSNRCAEIVQAFKDSVLHTIDPQLTLTDRLVEVRNIADAIFLPFRREVSNRMNQRLNQVSTGLNSYQIKALHNKSIKFSQAVANSMFTSVDETTKEYLAEQIANDITSSALFQDGVRIKNEEDFKSFCNDLLEDNLENLPAYLKHYRVKLHSRDAYRVLVSVIRKIAKSLAENGPDVANKMNYFDRFELLAEENLLSSLAFYEIRKRCSNSFKAFIRYPNNFGNYKSVLLRINLFEILINIDDQFSYKDKIRVANKISKFIKLGLFANLRKLPRMKDNNDYWKSIFNAMEVDLVRNFSDQLSASSGSSSVPTSVPTKGKK